MTVRTQVIYLSKYSGRKSLPNLSGGMNDVCVVYNQISEGEFELRNE